MGGIAYSGARVERLHRFIDTHFSFFKLGFKASGRMRPIFFSIALFSVAKEIQQFFFFCGTALHYTKMGAGAAPCA